MLHVIAKAVVALLVVMVARAETAPGVDHTKRALNSAQSNLSEDRSAAIQAQLDHASQAMGQGTEQAKSNDALLSAEGQLQNNAIGDMGKGKFEADIQQLVDKFNRVPTGVGRQQSTHTVLIFVSESVPLPAMRNLLEQSEKAGVPLVFRGFIDSSLRNTLQYLRRLMDINLSDPNAGANLQFENARFMIDPVLFQKFGIDRVPAFTVIRYGALCLGPTASCGDAVPEHYSVFGDVSLIYAVDSLQRLAPSFEPELSPVHEALKVRF